MKTNREKLPAGDIFHRVLLFALCSVIVLVVYFITMLPLNTFARGLFLPDENGETAFRFLPENFWFILYSLAYILPLYFLYFRRSGAFKTFILGITEEKWDVKDIFCQFTLRFGKTDLILYTAYAALMLLPFPYAFDNPAIFITVQAGIFYLYPIPRIVSYLLSVTLFAVQYFVCLYFAARYWDKNRLHARR